MKDKVLRLCKRLDKFTLDEIGTISELNSEVLLPLLEMFVKNKKLIKKGKIYQYNKNASSYLAKNRLPQRYQHHSKQDIDYMIKCFCADVEVKKVEIVRSILMYAIVNDEENLEVHTDENDSCFFCKNVYKCPLIQAMR